MEYDFFSGNRMWIPSVFRPAVSERSPNATRQTGAPGVLVVTADDKFYYLLLSLAIDLGWGIRRARNLLSAADHMASHPMPIVVYDERLPYSHWRDGLRALGSLEARPLILLATRRLDEEIWRIVLECKGYDALERDRAQGRMDSNVALRLALVLPAFGGTGLPRRRGRFQSNVTFRQILS